MCLHERFSIGDKRCALQNEIENDVGVEERTYHVYLRSRYAV